MPNSFPEWLHHFTFSLPVYVRSSFPVSSPACGIIVILYGSSSDNFVVISHCGLNLYFPNLQWSCMDVRVGL